MSIAYDKRDFRDPNEILNEGDNPDGENDGGIARRDSKYHESFGASKSRVDKMAKKLRDEAKYDAVEIFDKLTSGALRDFVESFAGSDL